MRVIVALEHRFDRTPDGRIWSRGWIEYRFWQRYLDVFDEVIVLARVRDVEGASPEARRCDGPSVSFHALPYYQGPWQYLTKRSAIIREIAAAIGPSDAVILRAPGTIAGLAERALRKTGHPYGVEVVGDPLDVFSKGGVRTILNPVLRVWIPRQLRRQCRRAVAVAYVTRLALQNRYPAGPAAFATWFSTINLDDDAYVAAPRVIPAQQGSSFRLLVVGSLEHLIKGVDLLINAVAMCRDQNVDLSLRVVGDGIKRLFLEQLAKEFKVDDRVTFVGRLPPGAAVRAEIDAADLFVLPTRTEGLPRVLIEAMARAAPCIATSVGGIPELLEPDDLVGPGDASQLAEKIAHVRSDPQRLRAMSERNLARSREFHIQTLQPKRKEFYERVKKAAKAN